MATTSKEWLIVVILVLFQHSSAQTEKLIGGTIRSVVDGSIIDGSLVTFYNRGNRETSIGEVVQLFGGYSTTVSSGSFDVFVNATSSYIPYKIDFGLIETDAQLSFACLPQASSGIKYAISLCFQSQAASDINILTTDSCIVNKTHTCEGITRVLAPLNDMAIVKLGDIPSGVYRVTITPNGNTFHPNSILYGTIMDVAGNQQLSIRYGNNLREEHGNAGTYWHFADIYNCSWGTEVSLVNIRSSTPLLMPSNACFESEPFLVSGRVIVENHSAVSLLCTNLEGYHPSQVYDSVSSEGYFTMTLRRGTWDITAQASGYVSVTRRYTISEDFSGINLNLTQASTTGTLEEQPEPLGGEQETKPGSLMVTEELVIIVFAGCFVLSAIAIAVFILTGRRRRSKRATATRKTVESKEDYCGDSSKLSSILMEKSSDQYITDNVTIGDRLGGGHFGDVYRGFWLVTPVALKKLKNNNDDLIKEALIMKELRHPNCVKLLGFYISPTKQQYIVTELITKGDLLTYIQKNREDLKLFDLLTMALDAVAGLAYLHSCNVIHGDLALRNLLVDDKPGVDGTRFRVKLSDFGMSKVLLNKQNAYQHQETLDLPFKWCSPELLEGHVFSFASDIWAMGVTLWELFSWGKTPYPGVVKKNMLDYLKTNNNRLPNPVDCPKDLFDNALYPCWNWLPEDRPAIVDIAKILQDQLRLWSKALNSEKVEQNNDSTEVFGEHYQNTPRSHSPRSSSNLSEVSSSHEYKEL